MRKQRKWQRWNKAKGNGKGNEGGKCEEKKNEEWDKQRRKRKREKITGKKIRKEWEGRQRERWLGLGKEKT